MIRKIDRTGISRKFEAFESFIPLDVASLASYQNAHLPKAVHLPVEELEKRHSAVLGDHGAEIIVYDDGTGAAAWQAARKLHQAGYYNLYVYEGGRRDWTLAGLSLEAHVAQSPAQTYNPTFPMAA